MEIEVHCELLRNAAVEKGNNYNHCTVPVHGIEELIDSSLYAVHVASIEGDVLGMHPIF